MPEHLVFTLSSTFGAMGDLAGHERRGSSLWPGRSAVLGLVAAALGIRREEAGRLADLERLSVAVSVLAFGEPLRDYHTVETIPTAAAKRPDSRRAALAAAGRRTNTTVTLRDYRMGPLFTAALWGEGDLAGIEAALCKPAFTVYLGRKACPLSAPMAPRIVAAPGPVEALAGAKLPPWSDADPARPLLVASDPAPGLEDWPSEARHDRALDRAAWHFAERRVFIWRGAEA